jgi:UDP-glucose 4-epimerase
MREVRNCNVCVTGGAGFLGSHLVDYLIQDRECRVVVIDNLCAGRREFVHPQATFVHHDITGSEEFMRKLFQQRNVEYVFSYAAHPYVPDSFDRPIHVAMVNHIGALRVINAAQEAGCKGVLQVSSAEVYGDSASYNGRNRITEDDYIEPHSSYGAAKAAVDAMIPIRWREAKTPVIGLRQFNCLGERDVLHPYVVVEIARQLHEVKDRAGKFVPNTTPVIMLGNNSTRDFMYAGDAVKAAVELMEKGEFGQVYNLGSEESVKVYFLAGVIGAVMGFKDVKVEQDPCRVRPWEIWHLQSDNSKLYEALGHRTHFMPLVESVRRTIGYYEETGWVFPWK